VTALTVIPRGLSARDIEERKNFIGGSDANIIMNGAPENVAELLAIKRGEKPPKNLDDVLAVQMGTETEDLNRRWFARMTGRPVANAGERRTHVLYDWMAQTLDGMTTVGDGVEAVFEAKHTSERSNMEQLVDRYYPQLMHAMIVSNLSWSVLSVFFGNGRWDFAEVPFDTAYGDRLMNRERIFWDCRLTGKRWPDLPDPPRPDIAEVLKISKPVDMSTNNRWCDLAATLRHLKPATERYAAAVEEMKTLVDREVKVTFGAGVSARVAKNGSVTLNVDTAWQPANDDDLTY
jgi:predicted phage-related endonuclease